MNFRDHLIQIVRASPRVIEITGTVAELLRWIPPQTQFFTLTELGEFRRRIRSPRRPLRSPRNLDRDAIHCGLLVGVISVNVRGKGASGTQYKVEKRGPIDELDILVNLR